MMNKILNKIPKVSLGSYLYIGLVCEEDLRDFVLSYSLRYIWKILQFLEIENYGEDAKVC